ncbi:MAG: hypothetical protein ACREBS_01010 [Nitrososphaerales archaeon]
MSNIRDIDIEDSTVKKYISKKTAIDVSKVNPPSFNGKGGEMDDLMHSLVDSHQVMLLLVEMMKGSIENNEDTNKLLKQVEYLIATINSASDTLKQLRIREK